MVSEKNEGDINPKSIELAGKLVRRLRAELVPQLIRLQVGK